MNLQKARDGSLLSKYVAGATMLVGLALIGLGIFKNLSVKELAFACGVIVLLFAPVDINLVIEKLTGLWPGRDTGIKE